MGRRGEQMGVSVKNVIVELLQKGYIRRKINDMLNIPKLSNWCLPDIFWRRICWKNQVAADLRNQASRLQVIGKNRNNKSSSLFLDFTTKLNKGKPHAFH